MPIGPIALSTIVFSAGGSTCSHSDTPTISPSASVIVTVNWSPGWKSRFAAHVALHLQRTGDEPLAVDDVDRRVLPDLRDSWTSLGSTSPNMTSAMSFGIS